MIIYKTINLINGKIYIGKSCQNNKNYLGSGTILKKAIKKYGKDNFTKEVLEEGVTDHDYLCEREKYWIKICNSTNSDIGYNICLGGEGVIRPEKYKNSNKVETEKMAKNYLVAYENYCQTNFGKSMKSVFNNPLTKKEKEIKKQYIEKINCIYAEYCQTHFKKSLKDVLANPQTKYEERMKIQYSKSIKAEEVQNISGFIRSCSPETIEKIYLNRPRRIKREIILSICNLIDKGLSAQEILKIVPVSLTTIGRAKEGKYKDIYNLPNKDGTKLK